MLAFSALAHTSYAERCDAAGDPWGQIFYFRGFSELYRNENGSILVFDGAYPESPNSTDIRIVEFAGNMRQEAQVLLSKVTVWIGGISWLSQPLALDIQFSGSVAFHVWLESDDPDPSASGIGIGLTVIDDQGATVGEPEYSYQ